MTRVFLGYDHQPAVNRFTLHEAAKTINEQRGVYEVTSWEDLRIDGQVIIGQITQAIDVSDIALFDLTTLNPNVLFELGYAIASKRRVGLLMEGASASAAADYKRYGLLREIGYYAWSDKSSIIAKIVSGDFETDHPLGEALLAAAGALSESTLFVIPAMHRSEPDSRIRTLVERAVDQRVQVILGDPNEARLEPLNWYASKAYGSAATLLHFESPHRTDHATHNARLALVGGMAHGFGRSILMLADEQYEAPLDYEHLLKKYSTAAEAEALASAWLEGLTLPPPVVSRRPHLELAVELKSLTFGEHVAENEVHKLPSYFIETAEYRDVLAAHLSVFIGRKGTGKTANLYLAAADLRSDRRNLVVVIRPAAYDFEGLVSLTSKYSDYVKSYAIDGIWRLLLLSEIARTVADELNSRSPNVPLAAHEEQFLTAIQSSPLDLQSDFGSRVDAALHALGKVTIGDAPSQSGRDTLNEALHTEWIGRLRNLLSPIVRHYDRIAILIDNLDKGWERSADLNILSDLLLGLLSSVGNVEREITRELRREDPPTVSLAVFLRSDIFAFVKERAREPDKIVAAAVQWDDAQVLRRVIEARFLATRSEGTNANELWSRYFCPTITGVPTPDYIINNILPRPRDLIYLCNAAVGIAINRGHSRVEEEDVLSAQDSYSQFAFEALLVENGITVEEFEAVLLEFLEVDPYQTRDEVLQIVANAHINEMKVEQIFARLKAVSFLGIETRSGIFEYPDIGRASEKAEILARKNSASEGAARLCIHPAFRAFLAIGSAT